MDRVYPQAAPDDPSALRVWPDHPDHPASVALVAVTGLLGAEALERIELHVTSAEDRVRGVPSDPPVIRIPAGMLDNGLDLAVLRFHIARAAAFLCDGWSLARVDDPDVSGPAARLVIALFEAASGGGAPAGGAPADLPRHLVRAARAALSDDAPFSDTPPDADRFLEGISRTADRLGLLASGDPRAALRALVGSASDRPGECAEALRSTAAAADLVCYAVSEDHFFVRRAVGLAVTGSAP